MIEPIINFLSSPNVPVWVILFFAFFISFFEHVFPPSPSDTILIFLGGFVGIGKVGFFEMILFATIGSTVGFLTMYYLGVVFGHRIIKSKRWSFITEETLVKPRLWFSKYGYIIIIVNRFLSGTRAVISFFAGITDLNVTITIILSTVSAVLWNGLLIYLGMMAGKNYRYMAQIIEHYGNIFFLVVLVGVVIFTIRFFYKKRKAKNIISP